MSDEPKSSPLPPAMLEAQRQVQAARKDSTNSFHGYKYASAEEVICVARDALNGAGLTFSFATAAFERFSSVLGKAVGVLHLSYQLEHSSGAARIVTSDIAVVLENGRDLDKAIFAARTESLGYALRDLLLIPRSDAPDVSGRDDSAAARQERRAEPQRQAPPAQQPSNQPGPPVWAASLASACERIAAAADTDSLASALLDGRRTVQPSDVPALDMAFARRIEATMGAATTKEHVAAVKAAVNKAGKFAAAPWSVMLDAKAEAEKRIGVSK